MANSNLVSLRGGPGAEEYGALRQKASQVFPDNEADQACGSVGEPAPL